MTGKQRVVITGLGIVAPNGIGIEEFWQSLIACKSGISEISLFDATELKSRIGGEINNFDLEDFLTHDGVGNNARINKNGAARHTQLALAATVLALRDASLDARTLDSDGPVPLVVGISSSAFELMNDGMEAVLESGPVAASPNIVRDSIPGAVPAAIAKSLGMQAQCRTISDSCPSGLDAIEVGAEMIRTGKADVAIVGGTDAPIAIMPFANFMNAGLASTCNTQPTRASRPFDLNRDSGVISEGAGFIILENLESALARGAKLYIEVTGFGISSDPHDNGNKITGLDAAMRQALANAGRRPEHVDYICAHGSGHPELDRAETQIIKKVFGKHAYSIPVSSIKGVTGNPMAAAGPLQVIACCLAMQNGLIPPTANYERSDPQCDLDYVTEGARLADPSCIVVNTHGVCGNNSSLVLESINFN
jgi:3-oxoacyl-[acyl-carrier-protein] synthase II